MESQYPLGMHPGATWKKCDFQVHSPRDPNWSGTPHLPGGNPEAEAARLEWARDLVAQSTAQGLDAIAMTDHHDVCFIPYVLTAAKELEVGEKPLWVFPGMEITCSDAVQCLILFDLDTQEAMWGRLFGGHLLAIDTPDAEAGVSPQATLCGKVVSELIDGIHADAVLSRRTIVLPHASNDGAHKSMLRQGFHDRFRTLPFDGIYTDRSFQSLDDSAKRKIWGQVQEWGSRRRGIVPTGDNRDGAFGRLGAHACWMRLGEPTTEAIRQALLADEARIAYEAPTVPAQRLLRVRICSTLTGSDFALVVNDGFTALIGGRGSGKSAVLEYTRFGLGRGAAETDPHLEDAHARERRLIEDTLGDGYVEIWLERDGVREIWRRSASRRDLIEVTLPDGTQERVTVAAAQQRFRARAFYQKQLSTLVSDARAAADQITGIAAAEFVDRRRDVDQAISASARQLQVAFSRMVQLWEAEAKHRQCVASVADLQRRIQAIRERLATSGLGQAEQEIIERAPLYNSVEALVAEAAQQIQADLRSIGGAFGRVLSTRGEVWEASEGFPEVAQFVGDLAIARGRLLEARSQADSALRELEAAHERLASAFSLRLMEFRRLHQAAAQQEASVKALIEESNRLVGDLQRAEAAERQASAVVRELSDAEVRLAEARESLTTGLQSRRAVLSLAAGRVQEMSARTLRAAVRSESCPREFVAALNDLCEGQRVRDLLSKCEERASELAAGGDRGQWLDSAQRLVEVYRVRVESGSSSPEPPESVRAALADVLWPGLTEQQCRGIFAGLTDTKVARLLTAAAEDYIAFEYRDAGGYIPFHQASPGQQASALLHLLLNQEAGTLIIDQPEDDLDNKVIMDVVRLLQMTKRRRQLIFATHNPNFVVNGDADKVVALSPAIGDAFGGPVAASPTARVRIETDGAIETLSVRDAITEIMEGGRAAFELRSRKYLFS